MWKKLGREDLKPFSAGARSKA